MKVGAVFMSIKTFSSDNGKDLQHMNSHLKKLSDLYDDVHVEYNGVNAKFSCQAVNTLADNADFYTDIIGVYCNFQLASPFRKTYVPCDECAGDIKVYTEPFNIPIYVIPEFERYSSTFVAQFLVTSYEDVLRRLNMRQEVFAKCRQRILDDIKEYQDKNKKVNLDFLNASVKNLIAFT